MPGRRQIQPDEENTEINMSPLIDMVFILLIFFIVTTVFIEETGVEVSKPSAASAVNLEKQSILIAITANGQVIHGGREIGTQGIRATVRRLVQKEKLPVILQVDEAAPGGIIVRAIDESVLGGAKNVSVSALKTADQG